MDARRDHRHPGRPDHDGVARAGCRGRSCGTGHAGGGVRVGPQAAEPQHRTLTGARTGVNMVGTAGPDRCGGHGLALTMNSAHRVCLWPVTVAQPVLGRYTALDAACVIVTRSRVCTALPGISLMVVGSQRLGRRPTSFATHRIRSSIPRISHTLPSVLVHSAQERDLAIGANSLHPGLTISAVHAACAVAPDDENEVAVPTRFHCRALEPAFQHVRGACQGP
jgi:hypothetical protein